jgi:hypothetical protein
MTKKVVIQWENGLGGLGGLGGFKRIFLDFFAQIMGIKPKKNPCPSARSAQSVLPLYHNLFCHVLIKLITNFQMYKKMIINL